MDEKEIDQIDQIITRHNAKIKGGVFSMPDITIDQVRIHSKFKEIAAERKVREFLEKNNIN